MEEVHEEKMGSWIDSDIRGDVDGPLLLFL